MVVVMTTRLQTAFLSLCACPPQSHLSRCFTYILCLSLAYLCLVSIDPTAALLSNCTSSVADHCRGAELFTLFIIYVAAVFGGAFFSFTLIPPLLGMVVMGAVVRNILYTNFVVLNKNVWSSSLRKMAFAIFLIKTGLDIDFGVLKRFQSVVLRLALIPSLVEGFIASLIAHFILYLPWFWSFTLGFILGAVSPTVVVPAILEVERLGLGLDQGPTSLIMTAASIDNAISLATSGIAFYLTFSKTSDMVLKSFQGPIEVAGGVSYGIFIGFILWFIPSADNDNFMFYRSLLVSLAAFGAIFGSTTFNIHSAGPIAVITLAIVVAFQWKKENCWKNKDNTLVTTIETLWWFLQPFLFGLIGAEFYITLDNLKTFGLGLVIILVSLVFRMLTTFLVLFGTDFNVKERLFICISWIPKASIQAAIAPLVLELVLKNKSSNELEYGKKIVAISTLSIIFTSNIGAPLISVTASKLLRRRISDIFESHIECQVPILESQRAFETYETNIPETTNESV